MSPEPSTANQEIYNRQLETKILLSGQYIQNHAGHIITGEPGRAGDQHYPISLGRKLLVKPCSGTFWIQLITSPIELIETIPAALDPNTLEVTSTVTPKTKPGEKPQKQTPQPHTTRYFIKGNGDSTKIPPESRDGKRIPTETADLEAVFLGLESIKKALIEAIAFDKK